MLGTIRLFGKFDLAESIPLQRMLIVEDGFPRLLRAIHAGEGCKERLGQSQILMTCPILIGTYGRPQVVIARADEDTVVLSMGT